MDRRERSNNFMDALLAMLQGWQSGIWTACPAIIVSFDPASETVTAQPSIQAQNRAPDGKVSWQRLPVLVDVPVIFPSGGGFTLTFPIAAGDECLVIFASRCIDAWRQSGGVQVQPELRMHDLSDGFALVGVRSQPRALPNVSTTSAQLRSDDGLTYVELGPDGLVRAQGTDVQVHARHSYSWDVNGFGERVTYLGGNVWNVHKWQTPRPGDTVTTTDSQINPPEIP